jgi:hypothetical protein
MEMSEVVGDKRDGLGKAGAGDERVGKPDTFAGATTPEELNADIRVYTGS